MGLGDNKPLLVSSDDLKQLLKEAVNQSPHGTRILSVDEIENISSRSVVKAFTTIGIDAKNPLQMQKDFAFIRKARKTWATTVKAALTTAVGLGATGIITALLIGIKAYFKGHE